MSGWDWKLDEGQDGSVWWVEKQGHRIEGVRRRNATEARPALYHAYEDDVLIINHNNGRIMTFATLAEIRRWFDATRRARECISRNLNNPQGADMVAIKFPIQVNEINFSEDDVIKAPLFRGAAGDFVAVRPCADKYENKTFIGIMIGDVARSKSVSFNRESGALTFSNAMHNPAMLVPELGEIVYGCGSWWSLISSPEDMKKITDQDIDNVWYVQALKSLEEKSN